MSGAEPYFARGGATGVVLMHGFTASPHEVIWLGKHLAGEGHTVYVPRLSGHGTRPEDLSRARFEDWVASAFDALHIVRAQSDRVVMAGLSMGGCLALNIAAQAAVDGVVAMAAPLQVIGVSANSLRWGKYLRPYTDQTDRSPFTQYLKDQQAGRGEVVLGRVRYNKWSTNGVEQLMRLIEDTHLRLPNITAPVLALYSLKDSVVRQTHFETLKAGLTGTARLETHLYERSDHIMTQDTESADVFARVSEFIKTIG